VPHWGGICGLVLSTAISSGLSSTWLRYSQHYRFVDAADRQSTIADRVFLFFFTLHLDAIPWHLKSFAEQFFGATEGSIEDYSPPISRTALIIRDQVSYVNAVSAKKVFTQSM
jgi:hypothetical protein